MKLKKTGMKLIACCLAVSMLSGCSFGGKANSVETIEEPEVKQTEEVVEEKIDEEIEEEPEEEVAAVDEEEGFVTIDGQSIPTISVVGDEINGYIELNEGKWVRFKDEDLSTDDDMIVATAQAISSTQKSIITLITYDTDLGAELFAQLGGQDMENDGGENVQSAKVTLGDGIEAYQLYCYYPSDDTFFVTWYFDGDDGYVHYVGVEFPEEEIFAFDLCEKNYICGDGSSVSETESSSTENTVNAADGDIATVKASLETPAKLNEWVETKTYCVKAQEYRTVYFRIIGITRGAAAQEAIDAYNDSDHLVKLQDLEEDDLEYCYCDYEVYFPEDFPQEEWGISTVDLDFSICNTKDSGAIANYIGLSTTWEINEDPDEFFAGDTYSGRFVFAMVKDFKDFLLKYYYYENEEPVVVYADPN